MLCINESIKRGLPACGGPQEQHHAVEAGLGRRGAPVKLRLRIRMHATLEYHQLRLINAVR